MVNLESELRAVEMGFEANADSVFKTIVEVRLEV